MNAQPIFAKADASSADQQKTEADRATASVPISAAAPSSRATDNSTISSAPVPAKVEKKVFYDDREVYGM
ncbi:hypothetical protein [Verrucomicrobium sp. BvORR106]|uniref:hypothetical protein n=1 Tax=Verrucomicrobium sp. BvORR106 TaxID=1403819 RepID=UPI00056E8FF5|nr:hypothetical protein [Verrucomicrobium sp. BvORR106]